MIETEKLRRHGIMKLIFPRLLLIQATTDFPMNGTMYTGIAADSASHKNLANDLMMNLCFVYFETGRDIYITMTGI